jgi:hypothetical protein
MKSLTLFSVRGDQMDARADIPTHFARVIPFGTAATNRGMTSHWFPGMTWGQEPLLGTGGNNTGLRGPSTSP